MAVRLQEVRILPELIMRQKLKLAAEKYNKYIDSDILVIYSRSKYSPFEMYEFMVKDDYFQYLAGVKHPQGAKLFYEKCLMGTVNMEDIVPVENMKTTSSKIEVLPQAIDLYAAKMYKIGEKDLETMKNRFTMAIGNSVTVMGIDERDQVLPIPVTVMNRKLTDFCSDPCSIFLIMKKDMGQEKYADIVYEKTKDILSKIELDDSIVDKIDEKMRPAKLS